jgi:tRNA pseudouridine38-40 synthase
MTGSRRAFRVAYDGRRFYGFQRQPDVPTVSDAVLDACRALGVCDDVPDGYAAAGRTDAGVSAVAQTVAFDCPDWCTPRALNSELPADVRAWASADAPPDFHATHAAARREYVYFLYAPPPAFDDGRAREALVALAGEHDFHNLTTDDTGTVRTLDLDAEREGDFLAVTVAADGFPRHLVRRLVALVRAVGSGAASPAKVERVLAAEPLDGRGGVPAAPPEPLVLSAVDYPGLPFVVDGDAASTADEVFEGKRVDGLVAARVAGAVCDSIASGSGPKNS